MIASASPTPRRPKLVGVQQEERRRWCRRSPSATPPEIDAAGGDDEGHAHPDNDNGGRLRHVGVERVQGQEVRREEDVVEHDQRERDQGAEGACALGQGKCAAQPGRQRPAKPAARLPPVRSPRRKRLLDSTGAGA